MNEADLVSHVQASDGVVDDVSAGDVAAYNTNADHRVSHVRRRGKRCATAPRLTTPPSNTNTG